MLKKPDPVVRIPGYREGELGPQTIEETRTAVRALLEPVLAANLTIDMRGIEHRDGRSHVRLIHLTDTEVWYQRIGDTPTIREPLEAILGYTTIES